MTIAFPNTINLAAQIVPDLIVQIQNPSAAVLNGVSTSRAGFVGVASWGPLNTAVTVGNYAQFMTNFGPLQVRKFDVGTHVAVAAQQGGSDFRVVRVSDGSDTAATGSSTGGIVFTARYSGVYGNLISVVFQVGSMANSTRVIVNLGSQTEVYDNLGAGLTGNPLLVAIANAINTGSGTLRGASQIVVASAGSATAAPGVVTVTLTGGTDGAAGVTPAMLLGLDGNARTGMYALRRTGCSLLDLVDNDSVTTWTTVIPFAKSEGMLAVAAGPSGDTISNAAATKLAAGVDDPWIWTLFGDYEYWSDPVNGLVRLVSPAAFAIGRMMNSGPQISPLNKVIYSIAGSQRLGTPGSGQNNNYSSADLTQIAQAGLDVITTPSVGGNYYSCRIGRNSSSDPTRHLVSYTRMTNFVAGTLNNGMGLYLGELISPMLFMRISATLLGYAQNLLASGILVPQADGSVPYSVVCDASNNPKSSTDLGIVRADVIVQYPGIVEYFVVNMQGGQTVSVTRAATTLTSN